MLQVLKELPAKGANRGKRVLCLCSCGREVEVRKCDVVSGHTISCGCRKGKRKEQINLNNSQEKLLSIKIEERDNCENNRKKSKAPDAISPGGKENAENAKISKTKGQISSGNLQEKDSITKVASQRKKIASQGPSKPIRPVYIEPEDDEEELDPTKELIEEMMEKWGMSDDELADTLGMPPHMMYDLDHRTLIDILQLKGAM